MKKINSKSLENSPEAGEILKTASKTFNGSKKIYLTGSKPEIRVPMREVIQTNSISKEGTALDINSDGSLNVRIDNQTKKISSGEVSININ